MEKVALIVGIYAEFRKQTDDDEFIFSEMIKMFEQFFKLTIDRDVIISALNT